MQRCANLATLLLIIIVICLFFNFAALAQRAVGPDICTGHVWIKNMAAIQSTGNSADDPMSCYFDPATRLGKRVLKVCDEHGGAAAHGCWVRGTFLVDRDGARRLTGVAEVQKSVGPGDRQIRTQSNASDSARL